MKTTTIKANQLVEDFDLYPRAQVNSTHVSHIQDALEAGVDLPPLIVDEKSKRIVDGFHRRRAYMRLYGDDADVPCVFHSYKNDAELYLEAMRLNASHGCNLTSYDRTCAISKAMSMDIDPEIIAGALNMKVEKVTAFKTDKCGKLENSRRIVPLKRSCMHLRGTTLTASQAAIIPKLGGLPVGFLARQIVMLLDEQMIDESNEDALNVLTELNEKLTRFLNRRATRKN